MFRTSQQVAFERLKRALDQRMKEVQQASEGGSALDDLERLAALRDRGVINEEEFAAKKKQRLGL